MEDSFATLVALSPSNSDSDDSDYSPKIRKARPKSTSFIAVRDAVYQLTCLNDFTRERIGGGFFAEVYKVTHKVTGEVMVLKMNKSRKNSKQMLAEIQLMNRLSHPNILGFKGSCVHEGQLHALTEFINGGNLEELLQNNKIQLSWSVRIKLAKDIACGMAYLHSKGVFHRDLTSKNCLIQKEKDGTMRCVVADFGLAAKIKHKRRSYTETVGSPFWMAPECLKGREYCEQADVFSFGIILAEIMSRLSADPDFLPRTNKFGVDYDRLQPLCEGCPPQLWELMLRSSQLDPDDRPTFSEICLRLETMDNDTTECKYTNTSLSSSQSEPLLLTHDTLNQTDDFYDFPKMSPVPATSPDLDSQLSSLLEGSCNLETDNNHSLMSRNILVQDNGCGHERNGGGLGGGDSGIDPGVYWKQGLALSKTPSLTDRSITTPVTPPSNHFRQTSDSSELSFQLPSPSFAWAPPPSPARQHRASLSFPSSPTSPLRSSVNFLEGSLSSPEHSPKLGHQAGLTCYHCRHLNIFESSEMVGVVSSSGSVVELSEQENDYKTVGCLCGQNNSVLKLSRTCCSTPNLQSV